MAKIRYFHFVIFCLLLNSCSTLESNYETAIHTYYQELNLKMESEKWEVQNLKIKKVNRTDKNKTEVLAEISGIFQSAEFPAKSFQQEWWFVIADENGAYKVMEVKE